MGRYIGVDHQYMIIHIKCPIHSGEKACELLACHLVPLNSIFFCTLRSQHLKFLTPFN